MVWTYDDLSKVKKQRVDSWLNPQKGNIKGTKTSLIWVSKYHKDIYNYIIKSTYADTTKRDHFMVLSLILRNQAKLKEGQKYGKLMQAYGDKVRNTEKKQELDDTEARNWVTHDQILAKLGRLKQIYENEGTYSNNIKYLAVALYVLIPPIRNDYHDMIYTTKGTPEKLMKNKDNNYLLKQANKYYIILNNDKTAFSYGSAVIPIESEELTKILNDSFYKFPRSWVFGQINDITVPYNSQYFTIFLKSIWNPEKIAPSVGVYRSSYITWYYDKYQAITKRDELAKLMRHSRDTAETNYRKLNDIKQEITEDEPMNIKSTGFDLKAWGKNYRAQHKEEANEKAKAYYYANKEHVARVKMLRNLNTGNTSKPTEQSITKYKLKYNDDLKRWY